MKLVEVLQYSPKFNCSKHDCIYYFGCCIICLCAFILSSCSHPHLSLLEQATLKQCVVGPNHAGFLLEVILENTTLLVLIKH